jgi:hypothetical protein
VPPVSEVALSVNTPAEVAELAVASGAAKASLGVPKMFVGGVLAGAYWYLYLQGKPEPAKTATATPASKAAPTR